MDRNLSDYVEDTDPPLISGTTDTEFLCTLCQKTYSRRDLRDRHRRRCAKTFGQKRASKRKSCENCAQKKLRGSLTRPACSRCIQVGTSCRYPDTSSTPVTLPVQGSQARDREFTIPLVEDSEPMSADLNIGDHFMSTTLRVYGIHSHHNTADISWNPVLNNMEVMLGLSEYATGPSWPDLGSLFSVDDPDHLHNQQSSSFISPQQTFTIPHSSESSSQSVLEDPLGNPLPFQPSTTVKGHMMDQSFATDISHLEGDRTDLSQKLLWILCEYPRLMLQHQFWSPFIHHNLYRCSQNGMAEPLGIALACVSAYVSSVESSFEFVESLIKSQREQLVRDFRLSLDRPETCLAALHAVCIYQILGLFEQKSADGGNKQHQEDSRKAAELHGSFLLKITRCLCKLHKRELEGKETGWSEWKFIESLRRNMFFVHIVNILAAETRRLHYDYFEPLDDDMILNMPLPAPECMWRACSEEEWRIACDYDRSISPTQCTLQDLLNLSHLGTLEVPSLQPLTRIILECQKIRPHHRDEFGRQLI
ncbi:C6 finger domain protein [Penicillium malachiteum]|uniref:C6 finger domain protein n=1 Tax=Penicillium malachiteum TaxID=1324776 RepID=UPI0025492A66|nr:C6 finger domain protein [Penicillium malachiteum]KAJ5731793.1 C6 finger domain protein [Penicillium malachiteum]